MVTLTGLVVWITDIRGFFNRSKSMCTTAKMDLLNHAARLL